MLTPPNAREDVEQQEFTHRWWDYVMVIATWEDGLVVSFKTKLLPYDPTIALLGIYPK